MVLEKRYQALQRETHPDRFSRADERRQRIALQAASHLNSAYNTLRDPLKRAVYLLELDGTDFQQQSRTMPAEFLMEQIELRERLDEAGEKHLQLEALSTELKVSIEKLFQQLLVEFDAQSLADAISTVQKLQFFKKLLQQIEDKLFELEYED